MKSSLPLKETPYSSLFLKLLEKQGLTDPESIQKFLFPDLSGLFDPSLMKGMSWAEQRLRTAVKNREKILVHGDYDVDGVTGAAIISLLLQKLGVQFKVFLPERERDGYGVSARAIREAGEAGFDLLVTVDCGVAAHEPIQIARDLGMDVIVIDHHKIPAAGLPNANAILNPLQEDCPYPFKELSAAGLAFKLSQKMLGDQALDLLDLAAISAVADVVPLLSENRIIVKKGLQTIAAQNKPGIAALLAVSKVRGPHVSVSQVGFQIAPRINAAGRMGAPDSALRLLVTESVKEAASLAQILESENEARKQIERRCTQEAVQWVERNVHFNRDKVIVAASENWHIGVIGIVAARLVEKFNRPAIVIGFQNGIGKGSGRSIPGFNLYHALNFSRENLIEAGGHAQAAGLSIAPGQVDAFRKKINDFARENLNAEHFSVNIEADLEIRLSEISENFLSELALLEPHGAGYPHPRFLSRGIQLMSGMKKLPFGGYEAVVSDGQTGRQMQFKEFDYLQLSGQQGRASFDAVYEIRKKSWNGIDSVVLYAKQIELNTNP